MKKFLAIVVMAVAALTANAQKGEYFITPRINIGYTPVSNFQIDDIKGGISSALGCDFEYMVSDQVGLAAAVDFNYMESDEYNSVKFKYSSLAIPVQVRYHAGQFAFKAGLQPTFKTSFEVDVNNGEFSTNAYSKLAESFVLYVPVGVSYTFKSTPIELGLNVSIPCTAAFKENLEGKKSKFTPISLSVGYKF